MKILSWWGQSYVGGVICPLDENRFNVSIKNRSRSVLCNVLLWQLCKQKSLRPLILVIVFLKIERDWKFPLRFSYLYNQKTCDERHDCYRGLYERVVLAFIFLPFLRFRQGAMRKRGLHLGRYFQFERYYPLKHVHKKSLAHPLFPLIWTIRISKAHSLEDEAKSKILFQIKPPLQPKNVRWKTWFNMILWFVAWPSLAWRQQ